MRVCAIESCRAKDEGDGRATFHVIKKDKKLRDRWLNAIGNWKYAPNGSAAPGRISVCSKHFKAEDYAVGGRRLRRDAVPTLHLPPSLKQQIEEAKDRQQQKRAVERNTLSITGMKPVLFKSNPNSQGTPVYSFFKFSVEEDATSPCNSTTDTADSPSSCHSSEQIFFSEDTDSTYSSPSCDERPSSSVTAIDGGSRKRNVPISALQTLASKRIKQQSPVPKPESIVIVPIPDVGKKTSQPTPSFPSSESKARTTNQKSSNSLHTISMVHRSDVKDQAPCSTGDEKSTGGNAQRDQLISILKERLETMQSINDELQRLRQQAMEETKIETERNEMLEQRINELTASHDEMIRCKDERKKENERIRLENQRLLQENVRLSALVKERNGTLTIQPCALRNTEELHPSKENDSNLGKLLKENVELNDKVESLESEVKHLLGKWKLAEESLAKIRAQRDTEQYHNDSYTIPQIKGEMRSLT